MKVNPPCSSTKHHQYQEETTMTTSSQALARHRHRRIPRPNMSKVNGLALLVQQISAAIRARNESPTSGD